MRYTESRYYLIIQMGGSTVFKRYFVRSDSLRPGMRIDQNIKDRIDRTLIARGAILDEYLIEGIQKRGIHGVYISEGER